MSRIISLYLCDNKTVNDAFDSTVANICLQHEQKGYKFFLLTGCEPGVGTTTISVELAISLSIAGWKTLLLDCDMRKVKKYKRLNDDTVYGLADYVNGNVMRNEIICHTNWRQLDYISSGAVVNDSPLRMLYSQKMSYLLKELCEEYDYIITDVPSLNSSVDAQILATKADATILVASLDGANKKNLEEARENLDKKGANLIGIIQNKAHIDEYKTFVRNYDYFNDEKYLDKKTLLASERKNRGYY